LAREEVMTGDRVLTRRQLNRATLARQMLLAREKTTALRAIERLMGMQAQVAKPPFIGLWSRVHGFRREDLIRLLQRRQAVRATLMRVTLHLVSARDFVSLRGALQPALTRGMQSVLRDRARGLDMDGVVGVARACLEERPRTFEELRPLLLKRFPKWDERVLGYAVRTHLPLVQVPSEAEWGFPGAAEFALAETWIGKAAGSDPDPRPLVLRYLAAFGPASAADMQTWSGLSGLAAALEGLRGKLVTFRDERGRELFDLPKAPRPDAAAAAPVRYLPEYDNLVLAHADRSRIVADAHRASIVTANLLVRATFLVDGFAAGTWRVERKKATATLVARPFEALASRAKDELADEGERLLRFSEPGAERFEVRFERR
jgi:hypothetical protein